MNDLIEYQKQRIEALERELASVLNTLLDISEISINKTKEVLVIDPVFLEPIKK